LTDRDGFKCLEESNSSVEKGDTEAILELIFLPLYDNLYKETFVNLYHQDIDYDPNDMGQAWLKQYGLIKEMNANTILEKIYRTIK
jgi:hypothetical protein